MKHKSTNDERYEQLSKFILPILFVLKFVSCSSFKITSSFFVILLLPVEIKIATRSQNAARCERHFCFVYSLSKAKAGGPTGRRRQGEAGPGVEGVQGEAASSRAQKESGFVPADLEKPSAGGGRREGRGGTFQRRGGSRGAVDAARPDLGCRQCLCPDSPLALQLGLGALAPPPQVLGALETQASGPGLARPVVKPTLRAVSRGGSVVPVTSPQEGVGPLGSSRLAPKLCEWTVPLAVPSLQTGSEQAALQGRLERCPRVSPAVPTASCAAASCPRPARARAFIP